jgi:hypothetical protein
MHEFMTSMTPDVGPIEKNPYQFEIVNGKIVTDADQKKGKETTTEAEQKKTKETATEAEQKKTKETATEAEEKKAKETDE